MTQVVPVHQKYFDVPSKGLSIGVHFVRSTNITSDTILVPQLANNTVNLSAKQLRRANDGAVTVTDDADDLITFASGAIGVEYVIVSLHVGGAVNYGAEADRY